MTSTPTEQNDRNDLVALRHPALGDIEQVPEFAVDSYKGRGYEPVPDSELEAEDVDAPDGEPKDMRHPALGDVVSVPWFAVDGYLDRGYEFVDDSDEQPAQQQSSPPAALPAPTGATSTRATTSGTAKTPAPDGDLPAATPAD